MLKLRPALLISLALVACGGDDEATPIDAPVAIDAAIDAGGPDAAAGQTCADYCASIAANCTNTLAMYADTATCLASCAHVAPGTAADMGGNTLGCRVYHAGAAAGNPTLHCRHAGPGGDGVCGADCEGFCTLVLGACAGQATPPYASMGACMTSCSGFATTPPYNSSVTGGNSFACRLYHATAASTTPGLHCQHTTPASATCN